MQTEAVITEVVVRCPRCGRFALRGTFQKVETICGKPQCRASFVAEVSSAGAVTVTVIRQERSRT